MTWVKVDDHFDEHPKLAMVGPIGWGVWLAGLAYCNRNLTDGFIPYSIAEGIGGSWTLRIPEDEKTVVIWHIERSSGARGESMDTQFVIDLLVTAGLWDHADGGYLVHDYDDFQPSRAEVLEDRRNSAERQALSRARRESQRESRRMSHRDSRDGHNVSSGAPVPVPVPGTSKEVLSGADAFEAYLRCTGRPPSAKASPWLSRLIDQYGDEPVERTIVAVWAESPDPRALLGEVENRLTLAAHQREKAADDARRRAELEYQRAERERIANATPEQKAKAEAIRHGIRSFVEGLPQ